MKLDWGYIRGRLEVSKLQLTNQEEAGRPSGEGSGYQAGLGLGLGHQERVGATRAIRRGLGLPGKEQLKHAGHGSLKDFEHVMVSVCAGMEL